MNKISLSLQGKQLAVFVASNKIQAFKRKQEFWKSYSLQSAWPLPNIYDDFSDKIGSGTNNMIFKNI